MKVAVVGAGWSGLSAAMSLQRAGAHVTVFESARIPGGRARRVDDPVLGALDNGQHLMLGAYTETLALIRDLNPGVDAKDLLLRGPLHIESLDASFVLHAPAWPAPWHALAALIRARGLTLADRLRAITMMASIRLRAWRVPSGVDTVSQLLRFFCQSQTACSRFWEPLCLAAMNTPAHSACAQTFLNVLRDSLGASAHEGEFVLARTDLTALWPEAASHRVTFRGGILVRALEQMPDGVRIGEERFDACVLAIPPYAILRLTDSESTDANVLAWRECLASFRYRPIATVTLRLAGPWRLPHPIMMLGTDHARYEFGQWVIDRTATLARTRETAELAVVISDADAIAHSAHDLLAARVFAQLRRQSVTRPELGRMPELKAFRVIVEKRATFDCVPGQSRPGVQTPYPRVWTAGDWTSTGYPAVLEGAVRSGSTAARALLRELGVAR